MRFYNRQHRHYCGIDLHVKTMYVCILDAGGQVLVHRNVKSTAEAFLEVVAPYREDLVVAAECMFTWYWLADLCAREGIAFVLGHALAMKAIHGAKAKNDKIDSRKIAALLRGGLLPQAYVYPAAMRSTRDLLRRRLHLVRKRGQLLAHIQNTRAQYQLPEFGRRLAYPANRAGVSDHFPDPSVRKSIDVDLALLERYDSLITDLELTIVREAKRHDGDAFHRLRSVPGIGKILALTILYEIHDITRFDRVQEFASYARLVKCQHRSAGKTLGTGGAKMGNVHVKWAFSEGAVLFLRHAPGGKTLLARIEKKHGKGKALSILAHEIGRAVYYMLARGTVFSMEKFRAEKVSVVGHNNQRPQQERTSQYAQAPRRRVIPADCWDVGCDEFLQNVFGVLQVGAIAEAPQCRGQPVLTTDFSHVGPNGIHRRAARSSRFCALRLGRHLADQCALTKDSRTSLFSYRVKFGYHSISIKPYLPIVYWLNVEWRQPSSTRVSGACASRRVDNVYTTR